MALVRAPRSPALAGRSGGDGGNRTRVQKKLYMYLRNVVCFLCLSRASSETDQMLASRFPMFQLLFESNPIIYPEDITPRSSYRKSDEAMPLRL